MEANMEYVNLTNAAVPGSDETRTQEQEQGQGGSVLYMPGPGEAGQQHQQYITIIQDGQTYAIPAADYNAMMAQQAVPPAPSSSGASSSVSGDPVLTKDSIPDVEEASSSNAAPLDQKKGVIKSDESKSVQKIGTKVLTPIKPATYGRTMKNIQPSPSPSISSVKKTKIFSGEASQRNHLFPTIQEGIQNLPEQSQTPKRNYKPIRVDNWGIFLLSRLQTYFQKKEYCDLTLRFPTKNAQIKVHKLILNACTDFFSQFEKEGKVKDNSIDMPANFTPETVAPIIRFMYTGKIELKESVYEKLRETAETLQMGVLTKLMDAQVNAVPDPDNMISKKSVKRKSNHDAFEEDPVEQMRKIRRIEKRVVLEGKRASIKQELGGPKLPGKKLPIWKKKINTEVQTTEAVTNTPDVSQKSNDETQSYTIPKTGGSSGHQGVRDMLNQSIEKSREEDEEGTSHIKIEPESGQLLASPIVGVTYQRRSPGEKPKIPRRVQEIQQHLMFEKVLKSGTKNNVVKKDLNAESSKDLSIDEVKELMQEQKQRLATNAPDEEDEDLDEYDYNNDTLGIGDDYIDNIDSPAPLTCQVEEESTHGNESLLEPETQKQSKITDSLDLESNDYQQEQHREKSVTNNLQSQEIESKEYTIQDFKPSVAKKTQVQIATARTELDEALEEFSRVAEEENEELKEGDESFISLQPVQPPKTNAEVKPQLLDPKKPRRGRPPRWLKEQTLQMGAQVRNKQMGAQGSQSIDLNKSQTVKPPPSEEMEDSKPDENQTQLVNEVFKKYPDLFKSHKAVKVKILTKDPTGKTVTKFITLKSQSDEGARTPIDPLPIRAESPLAVGGFKPVQKVMYTGKRGRPKKVKPGEYDPHLDERKKIEARLKRDYPQLASQLNSRDDIDLVGALMENENNDIPSSSEDEYTAREQISSSNSEAQLNSIPNEKGSPENILIEPSNSGKSTNLQASETGRGIPQYQPAQTFVMDPSQIQILGGGGQILSLDPNQQSQELIQLLSADGQIQFAVPKSKLTSGNISLPVQSLGVINQQQAILNTPGVVGISGQSSIPTQQVIAVGLSPMASLPPSQTSLVIPPGMLTLAPVQNYTQNAAGSVPTNMIPATSEMIQSQTLTTSVTSMNTETSPRVVHKIVSDWDSDEENQ